jgi:hypothetical protein
MNADLFSGAHSIMDANHALDTLGRKLALPALAFTDNQVGIDLTPDLTLFLNRLDDVTIEASCRLEALGHPDAPMMQAMLEANFLGGAVGPGRLAIGADLSEVILCESWSLSELDAGDLETRFDVFANTAAFWLTQGTHAILERAERLRDAARKEEQAKADAFGDFADGEEGAAPLIMRL